MTKGSFMRFLLDKDSRTPIYDQIREQIISALHVGRAQEGTRLPSVRHFARVHGVNPKTIHRIYRRLHDEGYVHMRPGSGAYIAPVRHGDLDSDRLLSLHRFFRASLAECQRMGLEPGQAVRMLESFVNRTSLRASRVAMVECTAEQVNLFAREIRDALRLHVVPVRIDALPRARAGAELPDADLYLTTDCHFDEVAELAASRGGRALRLRLHPDFIPSLMEAAEAGRLLMVLSAAAGMEAFLRTVSLLGLSAEALGRIQIMEDDDPARLRQAAARADTIYVSPLVADRVERLLPPGKQMLRFEHHLAPESLNLVEAALLFQAAVTVNH